MSPSIQDRNELREQYTLLAPVVSQWLQAFVECSDVVQGVIREMLAIIDDPSVDEEDKKMAIRTLVEALFPKHFNGNLGAELLEPEEAVISLMDAEEQTFAERVLALMDQKGVTQTQLGNLVGVGQSAISMMLNRQARPQQRTVQKIAVALGVGADELWPVNEC